MGNKFIRFFKNYGILLLILIGITSWFVYSYFSEGIIFSLIHTDTNAIISFVNSFGTFSYIIFILLVIIEVIFAPIPPLVLYVAAGFLFGSFFGGVLVLFGNIIGAVIDFLLARKLGRKFVEKRVNKKIREEFDKFSKKYGGFAIFFLRLNPFTSSDLFSYLAGLSKMKLTIFLAGTTIGLIPLIFAQTYFGEMFVNGNPFLSLIVVIISIFYFVILLYLILKILIKKKN
jgi:uncharacterized membrane protein YdjX (TVP38/TMEM64 family)